MCESFCIFAKKNEMKNLWIVVMLMLAVCAQGQPVRLAGGGVEMQLERDCTIGSVKFKGKELLPVQQAYPLVAAFDRVLVRPTSLERRGDTLCCLLENGGRVELLASTSAEGIVLEVLSCVGDYKSLMICPGRLNGDGVLAMRPLNYKTQPGIPSMAKGNPEIAGWSVNGERWLGCHVLNLHGRGGLPWAGPVADCRGAWVDPVPGQDGDIVGAKVLLGANMQKARPIDSLVAEFDRTNIDSLIAVCKRMKVRYLVHPNAFQSQGHYGWKVEVAKDDNDMKSLVAYAAKRGVTLGVRIQGNHISTNDAYVSPRPSNHLLRQLQFQLLASAEVDDTTLIVMTGMNSCFTNDLPLNVVRIEDELIVYDSLTEWEGEVHLLGCRRGAMGSKAAYHKYGQLGCRLWTLDETTVMADRTLYDSMLARIREMASLTGVVVIMDCLEDFAYWGHGGMEGDRVLSLIGQLGAKQ